MPKRSAGKTIRKSAKELRPASGGDLERLRRAMRGTIDTAEIPERRRPQRLRRDAAGQLPARKSVIRDAVVRQMRRRRLSAYRLWLLAREHYPPLSQSAVHEFLKGRRQLELPSIEALLAATDLRVMSRRMAAAK